MKRRCILMYHRLNAGEIAQSDIGTNDPIYTIASSEFAEHLQSLSRNEICALSLKQFLGRTDYARPVAGLTFDDGNETDYTIALPLLQKFGFTATFYVTTDWIGRPGFLQANQIRELADAGMQIGSHGHTHRYFDELSLDELRNELTTSCSILSEITGQTIDALAAPGGRLSPYLTPLAIELGITTIGTSKVAGWKPETSQFALPRIAIRNSTSLDDFQKIVTGNYIYYRKQALRSAALDGLKSLLGNRRYEQLRSLIKKK